MGFDEELNKATEELIIAMNNIWCEEKNAPMREFLATIWNNCGHNKRYFSEFMKATFRAIDPDDSSEKDILYEPILWNRIIEILINNINLDLNEMTITIEEDNK